MGNNPNYLEDHHQQSPRQFSFRRGRSVSDLLLLSKSWHDALDAGHPFLVIALDIAGACDCVWHRGADSQVGTDGNYRGSTASVLQVPVRQEPAHHCQRVHFSKLPCRGFCSTMLCPRAHIVEHIFQWTPAKCSLSKCLCWWLHPLMDLCKEGVAEHGAVCQQAADRHNGLGWQVASQVCPW